MGFVLNSVERNWQAKCIYELFREHEEDIDYALKTRKFDHDGILRIGHFENCRERGYTLTLGEKEVSFAEHRSSDDIVVYPFKWANGDASEKDYETKTKHFKYQQFSEAFNWILDYLGIEL